MKRSRPSRRVRKNALSKKKLLALGGLAAVGGLGIFLVVRKASAQDTAGGAPGPVLDPATSKMTQCAELQARLATLKAQTSPPMTQVRDLEGQLNTCLAEAREMGVTIEPWADALAAGDAAQAQTEASFTEYKGTDYSDALKRNNVRQAILNGGAVAATKYREAVEQASADAALHSIRASLARAIDASLTRRDCYDFDQSGCGRLGVNEDHGRDKANQERDRVLTPLLAAYAAVIQKLGGAMSTKVAPYSSYADPFIRSASTAKAYTDAKWAEYKSVDYSDAVRRNNLRQEVLWGGAATAERASAAVTAAQLHDSRAKMHATANVVRSALDAAITRWVCFVRDQPGCGRLGVNEDHGFDKANHERERVIVPLANVLTRAAYWLAARGDMSAYTSLIAVKTRWASQVRDFVNAMFASYKATDYTDAVKRNNLRQNVLSFGAQLAGMLRDAYDTAVGVQPGMDVGAAMRVAESLAQRGTFIMTFPAATSGLGAATTTAARSEVIAAVRTVVGVLRLSLDDSVTRRICYLFDQPGCGRFGVNEDHGNDKAAQEQTRVTAPMSATYDAAARFLVANGDASAEVPLVTIKLRLCRALYDYVNAKFAEYKTVAWTDAVRRNNLRAAVLRGGRDMVACFRGVTSVSVAGRREVRSLLDQALRKSQERKNCYLSTDASLGCGRFAENEPDGTTKANDESRDVLNPLQSLLAANPSLGGLGDADGVSGYVWVGAGLAAAWLAYEWGWRKRPVRANRSRRRTSRRRA